jgi:PST family polysaccharide transporter
MAGTGPLSLALGAIVSMLSTTVLLARSGHWRPSWPTLTPFLVLFSYGKYAMFNSGVSLLNGRLDNLLVAARLGVGNLGIYNRAYSLARIPTDQLGESIFPVIFSALSRIQDDAKQSRELCAVTILLIASVTAPLLLFLALCGPGIIIVLYGAAWAESGQPLQVMAVAGLFLSVSLTLRGLINAQGLVRQLFWVQLINLGLTASLVLALAPFGLTAIAAGIALREIANVWLMTRILRPTEIAFSPMDIARIITPVALASVGGLVVGGGLMSALEGPGPSWLDQALRLAWIGGASTTAYGVCLAVVAWFWKSHDSLYASRGIVLRSMCDVLARLRRRPEPASPAGA